MNGLIKQIRQAREKVHEISFQNDCLIIEGATKWDVKEVGRHNAEYITLLHNNIDTILDALEEAERKAKAGEELAEALSGSPYRDGKTYSIESTDSYWEEWRDRLLYIYNKTVNE